ncbi:ComEC/Rec2 family competence protein [Arthrobacter sp. C152]
MPRISHGRREAARTSPWSSFVDAAVRGAGEGMPGSAVRERRPGPGSAEESPTRQVALTARGRGVLRGYRVRCLEALRNRLGGESKAGKEAGTGRTGALRRPDVRLIFPALVVWGACAAGVWLPPPGLAVLCGVMAGLAGLLVFLTARGARAARGHPVAANPRGALRTACRSFRATVALALLLGAAGAAHLAGAASQRSDGPLADAAAAGRTAVAVVEVAGAPHALSGPGGTAQRWSVPVWTREVATGGQLVRTRARLVVTGAGGWGTVLPGQVVRASGKLKPAEPGSQEAGVLVASSVPGRATGGSVLEGSAAELRERFVAAAAFLGPDARGLLPGMVTGDTSALDEGLDSAMKIVGMTHLTAVSGANCSLVLGALLLVCRSCRLARPAAAAAALAGLGLFVVLVGPDASVLRAALMGAVAVASLAGGRSGRGLSFLCLTVIGLLLADPALGTSFGFLLSVLATLGIIVLGRRIIDWMPGTVPRWAAGAVAVPLSAQLLCAPVIVLLQPQFATYALAANVLASPLVAPVTLLGTAAVPLVVLLPWLATALIAVAGTFSAGVAATARFAAQLPGSALPWPEGVPGLLSMALLSLLTLTALWAATRPRRFLGAVRAAHRWIEARIGRLEDRLGSPPAKNRHGVPRRRQE